MSGYIRLSVSNSRVRCNILAACSISLESERLLGLPLDVDMLNTS
jgi:hypothetical protein